MSGFRDPRTKLFALGRLKSGEMNKTEAAYNSHLETLLQIGSILWFKFEALKFRLADNTFYSPDFAVMSADGQIEIHEVKGARALFQDDAKVKVKVASSLFPFKFIVAYPIPKKLGGGFEIEEY